MLPSATPETTRSCSIRRQAARGLPHRCVLRADDLELAVLVDGEVRPTVSAMLLAREAQRAREHGGLDALQAFQLVHEALAGQVGTGATQGLHDDLGPGVRPGQERRDRHTGIARLE